MTEAINIVSTEELKAKTETNSAKLDSCLDFSAIIEAILL